MPPTPHRSYILRLWIEAPESDHPTPRWSLEDPATGQRRGFASLEALMDYLREEVAPLTDLCS
jgi:hypothetical protein